MMRDNIYSSIGSCSDLVAFQVTISTSESGHLVKHNPVQRVEKAAAATATQPRCGRLQWGWLRWQDYRRGRQVRAAVHSAGWVCFFTHCCMLSVIKTDWVIWMLLFLKEMQLVSAHVCKTLIV